MQHLQPKTTLQGGKYRIERVLGQGGFGITYLARNTVFDVNVAIKEFFMKDENDREGSLVTMPNSTKTELFRGQKEKFKKEAKRMFAIKNEHIVAVHDLFEENGTAYYVMDYVDGENLAQRQKRTGKPMSEKKVREILPQILDALQTVHDAGMWHLDLKPANIMLDKSGQVKLIDFGASKQLDAQKGGATTSTAISYTNGFAPREQMEQNYDKFGPWTDLYALGATLYNLLTNQRPPLPTDIDDDMSDDKHLALPMPNVSSKMKQLILWLMKTNRMQRPQTIQVLKDFKFKEPPKEKVTSTVVSEPVKMVLETEETKAAEKKKSEREAFLSSDETGEEEDVYEQEDDIPAWKETLNDHLTDLKNIFKYVLYLFVFSIPAVLTHRCMNNEEQPKDEIAVAIENDSLAYRTYALDTLEYDSDLSEGERYVVNIYNKMLDNFVFVNGGTYEKGDPSGEWTSETHPCTVNSFWLSSIEVTQDLWKLVMGNNPSSQKGDNLPVDRVSWNDCQLFVSQLNDKLGALLGATFRLPTDDEWEYAARGGNNSKGYKFSGSNDLDEVAWTDDKLHEVGQKLPNELGLYDMVGNVSEWVTCDNCYHDNGYGKYSITRGYNSLYETGATRVLGYKEQGLGFRLVYEKQ